jgi:hypothetical protein
MMAAGLMVSWIPNIRFYVTGIGIHESDINSAYYWSDPSITVLIMGLLTGGISYSLPIFS